MYSLNMPVSALRTKMREEFERHRYVNQVQVVDVLLFHSHAEFQVRAEESMEWADAIDLLDAQETLNYWKQVSHVLKYFRSEEDPKAHLPRNFMHGFIEGRN